MGLVARKLSHPDGSGDRPRPHMPLLCANDQTNDTDRSSRLVRQLARAVLEPPAGAERFCAMFLDDRRSVLGQTRLGLGGEAALVFRLRELFGRALVLGASGIILAHNHPSGDCRPSERDIAATEKVGTLARALEIELLDHLIFTETAVYSMRAGETL